MSVFLSLNGLPQIGGVGLNVSAPLPIKPKHKSIMTTEERRTLDVLFELAEYYKLQPNKVRTDLERMYSRECVDGLIKILKDINELNA